MEDQERSKLEKHKADLEKSLHDDWVVVLVDLDLYEKKIKFKITSRRLGSF